MCRPKGRGFAAFWSPDLTYFGLESGIVFEGTAGNVLFIISVPH